MFLCGGSAAYLSTRVAIRAPRRMGVVLFVDLSAWLTTTRRLRTYPPDLYGTIGLPPSR
jgi:hypothetical protein